MKSPVHQGLTNTKALQLLLPICDSIAMRSTLSHGSDSQMRYKRDGGKSFPSEAKGVDTFQVLILL